jgi:amino acid adenylation domain-containing protein
MLPAHLLDWNRTEADYPRSSTIADLFAQQAARTPDAVAVVAGDRRLAYRQLDERANRLARHLQSLGVQPDTLVGVAMGRSETLIASLLGILKAGCAYVPLDPNFPRERLSMVIEDSGMPVLLTTAKSRARLPLDSGRLKVLDAEDPAIALESSGAVTSAAVPANLAYVMYTSGSTGKPKGVMVENRNVVNFFTGMDLRLGCEPGVWLAVTSMSFDISVLELLWTLTRGFTVVIHDDEGPITVADEIVNNQVTHLQMTPSLARMLTLDPRAFAALGLLKQMLLGGEAVPAALIHHLRQVFTGEIHNMYGPTETTIWSTTCRVQEVGSFVSIGRPIANTQIYMLDAELNPVPVGEVGELFIGGDGVARGYWNRPELTAERFLNFPALSDQRIYRTGDLARFLPDGNIEFLGRADYQVKLRGHRIEPGEIEALLEKSPGIRQAVVVMREDREGDKRLVAYMVAERHEVSGHDLSRAASEGKEGGALAPEGTSPDRSTALRAELTAQLPDYMVPSAFVFLDALPLTDNGKIDRKALLKLPPPVMAHSTPTAAGQPANETERIVARAWQEALGIPAVGMNENFFDLGAHSLTVAEAHAKLQQALGREIALVDLFQFSTVNALAAHLAGSQPASAAAQLSDRAARRRMARQSG